MLEIIKKASKDSVIYGLGNVSIKLVGLILIPFYTDPRYLSIADYGVLGIMEACSQILVAIIDLALIQAITRWYWDSEFAEKKKSMFFTVLFVQGLLSVLLFCLIWPFRTNISSLFFNNENYAGLFILMYISSVLQVWGQVVQNLMKLQSRSGLYTVSNIVKLIITLAATIYFVVIKETGLKGIYFGQIIGGLFFVVMLAGYIINNIKVKLEATVLWKMLNYSLPLVLGSISGILLSLFDRYSLNFLGELPDVAKYTLAFRISNTIRILVITSVQLALSPLIFQMMDRPGNKRFYSKIMTYFTLVVMICVLVLSLFCKEITKVFTTSTEYWDSYVIIPVLSFSILFGMLKDTALTGLQIAKKTGVIGTVIAVVAVVNLGLNILLIPLFGIMGAAMATLLSQVLFFVIIIIYAQKYYPIPYEFGKVAVMIFSGLALYLLSLLTDDMSLLMRILIKSAMLFSYPFILYPFHFYEEVELERIRGAWVKWKKPRNLFRNLKSMRHSDK